MTALLSQAGEITDVYLPVDRITGRPRGFAFVEFSSPEQAGDAIERFDGHELDSHKLRLDRAEARAARPAPRPSFGPPGGDGGGFGGRGKPSRPKGSRRGKRGKKRSL